MKKRIFGSGLDNILGISKPELIASDSGMHQELKMVLPQEIFPSKYQPRMKFDDHALQELADSIKEKGILQPLIVKQQGRGYELIAGERRLRAAQIAGLKQIPVVVCAIDDQHILAYALIENIQRQDLNPIEEANSFNRLLQEFAMTHEEIAKAIGRSRAAVTNILRLLNLDDSVKDLLVTRQLEMGHARALLSLPKEQQMVAATIVLTKNMTVRETETYVKSSQGVTKNKNYLKEQGGESAKILALEHKLSKLLGITAKINFTNKGDNRVVFYLPDFDSAQTIVNTINDKFIHNYCG